MPKYQDIAAELRRRLEDGEYPVGSQLPSLEQLSAAFGAVDIETVRQAEHLLKRDGLLDIVPSKGAFVRATPRHR